jgi:hypothetical protein
LAAQQELGLLSEQRRGRSIGGFGCPAFDGQNLTIMLQSIKQLYGHKLGALDGELGRVKDFYFDDLNWVVRYVIVDTGSWLSERQVLISPHAFSSFAPDEKTLLVNLTRKQIEDSPLIALHKPVSRQYEEEYFRHYGWPSYWLGAGLWGAIGLPTTDQPVKPLPCEPAAAETPRPRGPDAHLRSTQAVNGYHLSANDGVIGHVSDFLMDPQNWAITQLVVKTGHRISGKEVQVPTEQAVRISYEDSTVFTALTKEAVSERSASFMPPVGWAA